eukprot:TRINITY_DN3863_c0_g2_i2.p1 TRINITY_DN3863_c0_g2~~TRINITY_DN3863_c0_g2_i2.p1  ORF type:complete len:153 (-),score=4.27 TRINITY_DN3863_c0_g2_i2:16-474(-)
MYIKSGNPAETESSSPIGSVLSPFKWCNIAYSIVDENQKPIYFITGDRFQPSICCRCPCDPFKNVEFEIRNVENTETVGLISKRWNGCGKEFCVSECFLEKNRKIKEIHRSVGGSQIFDVNSHRCNIEVKSYFTVFDVNIGCYIKNVIHLEQ